MKILRLLVAVSLLGVSSIAAADPQDYTNLEVFLGRQGNIFLNGGTAYRIAGSYDLSDTFYVYGQYSNNTFGDFASGGQGGLDAKQSVGGGGLGMHFPVADATDYVIRFGLLRNDANTDFVSSTHNGYDLGMGFNTAISTGFELSSFIDHSTAGTDATTGIPQNISASAGETILSTGIHSQIAKNMDFGVTAEFSSIGQNRMLLSLRYDF